MKKHAAITIISKNYFAFAKTLAASYKTHHPENDFIIVLVDKADGYISASLPCGAEIIEVAEFSIPDISRFIYRYSIMELNTAVKPYVLEDLFKRREYETILYIDPDILIFRPLTDIYAALDQASIVLTPHMRKPYFDDKIPSDLTILQSGTYNLGFIGLKNTQSTMQLLDWWMTKLYRDCVVDIPKGLFVDQKWIDLVPGFFPDHRIVYSPGYNVAYWNLHERQLSYTGEQWRVDDEPLSFFHFSGYLPFEPIRLSKHENRHQLCDLQLVKRLTDFYAGLLIENGYEESHTWPYAFRTLSNRVVLPLGLVREVMQWASRAEIAVPCPIEAPDDFCSFLMSRGVIPGCDRAVVLFYFLLRVRGDVVAAFPHSVDNHDDAGFRDWVAKSGDKELGLNGLLRYEDSGRIDNYVADAFLKLRQANRQDIFYKYKDLWIDAKVFEDFANWFSVHGVKQLRCSHLHTIHLKKSVRGIERILNIYFSRGDLQVSFPHFTNMETNSAFEKWLNENRYELGLTRDEVSLFVEFANASQTLLEKMRLLYTHNGVSVKSVVSIYSADARRLEINSNLDRQEVLHFLCDTQMMSPADQFCASFGNDLESLDDFGKCSIPLLDPQRNYAFIKRLRKEMEVHHNVTRVNLSGYFSVASGMGESGRSMRVTLEGVGSEVQVRPVTFPNSRTENMCIPKNAEIFGWPNGDADVSITVANADAVPFASAFLPTSYWASKNIGYWVWETAELPGHFRGVESRFDEIWTPSQYAAEAIGRTVRCPVKVLPHTLDFSAIGRAKSNRSKFAMPDRATLFGFAFDPNSVLERKNVAGLIKAFNTAFREDDRAYLVLKVNGKASGAYDYEMLRAASDTDQILFIEAMLSRTDTFDFMKSLDVYVSLHRSEGFGLTCAEAMAMGLPVVASNYSGNLQFMKPDSSVLIPTTEIGTSRPYGPYPAGTRWGDPNLEIAADAMRSLLDRELRTSIGAMGRETVNKTLSTAQVSSICRSLLITNTSEMPRNGTPKISTGKYYG